MRLLTSIDEVPDDLGPTAIAIGKFDGVHAGHRGVIEALRMRAAERGLAAVVVTFDRNPLSVVRPDACPLPLVSNAQKIELLAEQGLDATLMLTFDRALSETPAEEFVERILVAGLDAKLVLAGSDFRFGARGRGDLALLERLGAASGFDVLPVEEVVAGERGRRASSTWIRELLTEGRVAEAAELLGRRPTVRSRVVHGDHRGRELGFPTANLDPVMEGFLPGDAVYAAWATIDGVRYPAAVSIGNNPTFEGVPVHQAEAHLLDASVDVYGREIELEFVEQVRPMARFPGVDELVAQLSADTERIREILAAAG